MSRRIIRHASLLERVQAYLNPWDFLLYISEELNSNDWEEFQSSWATAIGGGLNLVFLIARVNSGGGSTKGDDVFGEDSAKRGSGWLLWFCHFLVHSLVILSAANAFYTLNRRRYYRFFERPLDDLPSTPSARRVKVDSSPMTSSPLRFLYDAINSTFAEARAHPDSAREVTELAVWDPNPLCLRLFCLFSPAHVLVYWLFLPTAPLDPWPSVTVAKTVFLASLLSLQGHLLQTFSSQLTKDTVIVHKEVLHEYDTKYVHPSINRPARDVGIQTPPRRKSRAGTPTNTYHDQGTDPVQTSEVDTYSPYTIVNRGFHINPNPAYASQYDTTDSLNLQHTNGARTALRTPLMRPQVYNTTTGARTGTDFSSPLNPQTNIRALPFPSPLRQKSPERQSMGQGSGDGGSLGVHNHAASPLRKAASTNYLRKAEEHRDGINGEQRRRKEGSPLKRMSTPGTGLNQRLNDLLKTEGRRDSRRV